MKISSLILIFVMLGSGAALAAPDTSLFEEGEHCVAYKAKEKQFFIRNKEVVGKTCEISSQILPQPGEKYIFEIRIPIRSFRSGDTQRDEEVARILKMSSQSDLVFRSPSKPLSEWKQISEQEIIQIDGTLSIGSKSFPVTTVAQKLSKDGEFEFDGIIKTKLSHFDITPPKAVAGILSKVKDDVELHFHIVGSRTLGLETLL